MLYMLPGSIHANLILDHDNLEADLRDLIRAFKLGDWPIARDTFAGFERRLVSHFAREEQLLFPDFATLFPRETDELLEEHRSIRRRVDELAIGIDVHETRVTAIEDLAALIRRHAERENRLLYRWTDDQAFPSETATLFSHGRSPAAPVRS